MKTAAIIPALDEEGSIGEVVRGIDRSLVPTVIVADNGSSDATADRARDAGALVIETTERGYGAACQRGLEALPQDTEIVLFIDGDGSVDLAGIPDLLEPLLHNRADLVIGVRPRHLAEPGSITPQQRIGDWIATRLIRVLYGHRYSDLGPFRAIRKDLLDRIGMRDRRFGWTVEMQVRAIEENARIEEVPVRTRRRQGRSKISGTIRGVVLAAWWILSTIIRLRLAAAPPADRRNRIPDSDGHGLRR